MVYKWYILPIGGLYATYHLLGEPETTIEWMMYFLLKWGYFIAMLVCWRVAPQKSWLEDKPLLFAFRPSFGVFFVVKLCHI